MSCIEPQFGPQDYEVLKEDRLHEGFLNIVRYTVKHRRYLGGWSQEFMREIMLRHEGAGVLLYDPELDKVVLIEQFRAGCLDNPSGPWVIELVAGLIDSGETPKQVVEREAEEEAGLRISHIIPVCDYFNSPGGSNEKIHVFCARVDADDVAGIHGLLEEDEDIKPLVLDREDAMAALREGRINNAMSIIALQWLALNINEVRRRMG